MPELPEVETIKKQLQRTLIGKKIRDVFVYKDKMVKVGPGKISNIKVGSKKESLLFGFRLKNRKVLAVERRAKYLLIHLSGNHLLMIHLRMSGQLIFLPKKELKNPLTLSLAKKAIKEVLPAKHTHIEFVFSNGDRLFYNDTRQFGHIRLAAKNEIKEILNALQLGPEPLLLSRKGFVALVNEYSNRKAKDFLLDQRIIAGIGNIYADESLFISKIHPLRRMGSLKPAEINLLHGSIKKVLNGAIKAGGSSLEYFLMTNGDSGKFSLKHKVYGRAGKPCLTCRGPLISRKIAGRTTVYCPRCQR